MRMWFGGKKHTSLILVLALILLSGSLAFAGNGAKIKFKKESQDFGRVKQGEVLNYVFVFKNEGDEILEIRNVRTSCGCTAALVSNEQIMPGKEGEIKVTFDTRGFVKRVTKYVYVESNDPAQPSKELTLSAEIEVQPRPVINPESYSLDVGLLLEQEEIKARTKIENKGELELELTCFHKDGSFFSKGKSISFPLRIPAGKGEEIEIRIAPPKRTGAVREYVQIKSNDPLRPNLSLSLSAYVITKKQLKELFAKYKDILD